MTDNLLKHLRKDTLARMAAELIVDFVEDTGVKNYYFQTEDAKSAHDDIMAVGIARFGEDEFEASVESAFEAAWEAAHDALYR